MKTPSTRASRARHARITLTTDRTLLELLEPRTLLSAAAPGVTYQAESADLVGALALSNVPGFTGAGFADYQHRSGDSVGFQVDFPSRGTYTLAFRYANGSAADRPLALDANGAVLADRLSFAPTGKWSAWKDATLTAEFEAGPRYVRLTAVGQNGPNLDALTVTRVFPPDPVTLQAESATLSGATVGRGGAGFTGAGYADYQHVVDDYVEFTYDAPLAGTYTLEFRYAHGGKSYRPLSLKVNGAAGGPVLSFAPTGSWSAWQTVSATVPLARGRNTIRLTAIGRSGPNLDALTVRPGGPALGAVTYLSQSRSIGASLTERFDVVDPDTGEVHRDTESNGDSRTAPDFGDFDGSVNVRVTPPPGWQSGVAAGSQHSRLAADGVFISGDFNGHTETDFGGYGITSDADVTFELSQPRAYVLNYDFALDTSALPRVAMSLARLGGETLFEVKPFTEPVTGPTGTLTGTLAPGRYRYVMSYKVGGDVGTQGPYSVELKLTQ